MEVLVWPVVSPKEFFDLRIPQSELAALVMNNSDRSLLSVGSTYPVVRFNRNTRNIEVLPKSPAKGIRKGL
jgi:hypothetical protein